MLIYNKLLCTILYFVCVGIDITAFFLVVKAIILWKKISWLRPINDAGRSLIETYIEVIDRLWNCIWQKHLALRGKLLVGLGILELARILLFGTTRLLQYQSY